MLASISLEFYILLGLTRVPACLLDCKGNAAVPARNFLQKICKLTLARLEIENGEVQYLFFYNYPAQKSEEEIAAWMQAEKEKELKAFTPGPFFPDIGLKEFEEDYLIPNLNYRATWERRWTEFQKTSMAFQFLAPDETSFPRLYQYKMTIEEAPGITLESQAAKFPQPGLFFHLSYDTQLQVKEDIGDIVFAIPSIRTWSSDYHAGFHHLWAFGRSGYRVPDSTKYVGKEQIDGAECYVLAFEREDGRHAQIWIDSEKAFCIRQSESRENPDSSIITDIAEYKKFQRFGDVWYPTVIQFTLCCQVFSDFVPLFLEHPRLADIAIDSNIIWSHFNRLVIVINSLIKLALVNVSIAAIVIGLGKSWVQFNRLGTGTDGLIKLALVCVSNAESVIRFGRFWVQFNRLFIVGDSQIQIATAAVSAAKVYIILGVLRFERFSQLTQQIELKLIAACQKLGLVEQRF